MLGHESDFANRSWWATMGWDRTMRKHVIAGVLMACGAFDAAAADGVAYTYLDVGYVLQTIQSENPDPRVVIDDLEPRGGYVSGSVALNDAFHLLGSFSAGQDDVGVFFGGVILGEVDLKMRQYQVGFGYHRELSSRIDWVGEFTYLRTKTDIDEVEITDGDDLRITAGVRGVLAPHVEGWLKAQYTDGDAYDGEFSGAVGLLYRFNEMWGVEAEGDFGANNRQLSLGVRASF